MEDADKKLIDLQPAQHKGIVGKTEHVLTR